MRAVLAFLASLITGAPTVYQAYRYCGDERKILGIPRPHAIAAVGLEASVVLFVVIEYVL